MLLESRFMMVYVVFERSRDASFRHVKSSGDLQYSLKDGVAEVILGRNCPIGIIGQFG